MIDSTLMQCIEAAIALAVTVSSGLLGKIVRQLNRLENRVERLEEHHGLDTTRYHRKRGRRAWRAAALLALLLSASCATFKPSLADLRLAAAIAASETILADDRNRAALAEVSDALEVFCGNQQIDSLALYDVLKRLPEKMQSEKARRRIGIFLLLVERAGAQIKPADHVAWGNIACSLREGIRAGIGAE